MPRKKVVENEEEEKEEKEILNFTSDDVSNKLKKLLEERKKKYQTLEIAQKRYDNIVDQIDEEVEKISKGKETNRRMFASKILDCVEAAYGKKIPEDKYGAFYFAIQHQEKDYGVLTNAIEQNQLTGYAGKIPADANELTDKAINDYKTQHTKKLDELLTELEAVDVEINNILADNNDDEAIDDEMKSTEST